jgi:hypothetical protein
MFNKIITENETIQKIQELYLKEFSNVDFNKIIKKEYYRQELVYIDNDFKYEGKLHYYTEDNFKLFYLTGCVDSYLMLEWCNQSNDKVGGYYIEALYFSRLIEGRYNRKHSREHFKFNQTRARKIKDTLLLAYPKIIFQVPKNHIGKDVFITSFNPELDKNVRTYVKQIIKTNQMFKIDDLSFVNIYLKLVESNKNLNIMSTFLGERFFNLEIIGDEYQQKIWQRENLFMLGVHWCFGANIIILSDNYLEISDTDWLSDIKRLINNGNEFVLGYGNYQENYDEKLITVNQITNPLEVCNEIFLWAAQSEDWKKIESITKMSWGENTNELFHYQLTGELPINADANILDDVASKLFKDEKTITNVNSLVSVKYTKEQTDKYNIAETLSKAILKKVKTSPLGLLEVSPDNEALFDFLYYRKTFDSLDLFGQMNVLVNFNEKYGYTYNNDNNSKFLFAELENQKVVIDSDSSYILENKYVDKEFSILPFNYSENEFEIQVDFTWNFKPPAETGVYYLCFEVNDISLEDISIETQPKGLFLHGCGVFQQEGKNIIKIPTLLDTESIINIKTKLLIKSIFKKSIKFKAFEKITYDYNKGYLLTPRYKRDLDYIHFDDMNGSEYLFTLKFSEKINGAFYFTSGTDIIWPVNYSGITDIHYVYLKKKSDLLEVIIRNDNDKFSHLVSVETKILSLDFIERCDSIKYTLTPTELYINCNYTVDVYTKYILPKLYKSGIYYFPITLIGQFSVNDSLIHIKVSPDGVLKNGIDFESKIYSSVLYLPVYLTNTTSCIHVEINYIVNWSRNLEFVFNEPIIHTSDRNEEFSYYKKYHSFNVNKLNLGLLAAGNYLINLNFDNEQDYNLGLRAGDKVLWPTKNTGKSSEHEYEFTNNFIRHDLFLTGEDNIFSGLSAVTISRIIETRLPFWDDFERLDEYYLKEIKPLMIYFKNVSMHFEFEQQLFETFQIPLESELIPGNYNVTYKLSGSEASFINNVQLYHGDQAKLSPHFLHDYFYDTKGTISIPLVIKETQSFLDISLYCHIFPFKEFSLKILNIEPIGNNDDEFGFFNKVDTFTQGRVRLGKMYPSFYKIILFFTEDVQGEINLECNQQDVWYPIYTGVSNIHVFYFNTQKELLEVEVNLKNIKSDFLNEVHILKLINDH